MRNSGHFKEVSVKFGQGLVWLCFWVLARSPSEMTMWRDIYGSRLDVPLSQLLGRPNTSRDLRSRKTLTFQQRGSLSQVCAKEE